MQVLTPVRVSRLSRCFGLIFLFAAVACVPCFASTMFTDGTFNLMNYGGPSFISNALAAGLTVTETQNMGSGNPAPSLDFNMTWTNNTTFAVFVGLINNNFTYNPATAGAISTIDFSLDRRVTIDPSGIVVISNAFATILLQQGTKFYIDTISGAALMTGTWQTVSTTGLTASNFSLFDFTTATADPSQHPDFSTAGGVIGFGFRNGIGHTNTNGTGTFDILSDNLSITVNSVPEPVSAWVVLASLAGLASKRWFSSRGRRQNCKA